MRGRPFSAQPLEPAQILVRRPVPGEVRRETVGHQARPFTRFVKERYCPPDRVDQRIRLISREDKAVAAPRFPVVLDDGIAESAGGAYDRRRAVLERV